MDDDPASHHDDAPRATGPIAYDAARVLPVNAGQRVLLLQARDPLRPDEPFWFTVGGALDAGEMPAEGAARELLEETGIAVRSGDLDAPFTERTEAFTWEGREVAQAQVYFAVAVASDAVSFDGHDRWERDTIVGHAWWTPAELEASGAATSRGLPDLMRRAIAHVTGEPDGHRGTPALTREGALAMRGSGWGSATETDPRRRP